MSLFRAPLSRLNWGAVSQARRKRRRLGDDPYRRHCAAEWLERRALLAATPTSITVSASADAAVYGQALNLTADVAASPAAPSEGNVAFFDNGAPLGSMAVTSGIATLDTVYLPVGTHSITASYSDSSGNFAASVTNLGPDTKISTVAGGLGDGSPALSVGTFPVGVAVDATGNLFIADGSANCIREVDHATGIITTVAGNGVNGFSGDGGPATAAELSDPIGVAVDSSGDLFIADTQNYRVREVNHATGIITTVAGDGVYGFSDGGGRATAAAFANPSGVAVDSSGDLFIADNANNRIREVNLMTGVITTVAGNGTAGFSGDGAAATAAELDKPFGVAVDFSGHLFIADTDNSSIREVNLATGAISTIAGNGTAGTSGDGGPATAAELVYPEGVAVDSSGNLFIADTSASRVREVNHATGLITTLAGATYPGFGGDGGPATAATLYYPSGVAVDSSGNLFIADYGNHRVREVTLAAAQTPPAFSSAATTTFTVGIAGSFQVLASGSPAPTFSETGALPSGVTFNNTTGVLSGTAATGADGTYPITLTAMNGASPDATQNFTLTVAAAATPLTAGTITTVAGNGTAGFSGDSGQATAAELNGLLGVAVDSSGHLFIADGGNNRIREVNLVTGGITTVAGNGTQGFSGDGGQATAAELNGPEAVAVDSSGHLFIADYLNDRIREVDLATGVITTVAGGGTGVLGDGGLATAAYIGPPLVVAVDSSGHLFIADFNRIREVNLTTGVITTVAGNGTKGYSGDGGPATAAELSDDLGVAVDSSGHLFIADGGDNSIADGGNNRIREVDLATGVITTVAGTGASGFSGDGGQATAAELDDPTDLAVDSSGHLFIAEEFDNRVRAVDLATGIITTVAGNGTDDYYGDGGQATAAAIGEPTGVAVDPSGHLFVSDADDNRVREVTLASSQTSPALTSAATTMFAVGVAGNFQVLAIGSPTATFSEIGALPSGVTFNNTTGMLSGTPAAGANGTYPITLTATNGVSPNATQNFTLTVVAPLAHPAAGATTTVAGNGTQGFSGDDGPAIAAELNVPAGLAVDSSGHLFIADYGNNYIREENLATGEITTLARYGVDLNQPLGVALDTAGHLFIADTGNNRVREVDLATGVVTTVAGNGVPGFSGDGGLATAAELNFPAGVAVDSSGDLFIADGDGNRIREVNLATGVIRTVAGSGTSGFSGDGGLATAAELNGPAGIAVDSSGHLYIADTFNNRIREVNLTTGVIITVAGNGISGYGGDGGHATAAELNGAFGVAVDSSGHLFITDSLNNRVREVDLATGVITSVAELNIAFGVAVDASGHLFISDAKNQSVREVTLAAAQTPPALTSAATTAFTVGVAGSFQVLASGFPAPTFSETGALPSGVTFSDTTGVLSGTPAAGANGTYSIVLTATNGVSPDATQNFTLTVAVAHPAPGAIDTVAGNGTISFSGDGGSATVAELDGPADVAVDSLGDLFIADYSNNRIREVNRATGVITTVAGNGNYGSSGDGGSATAAELAKPQSVAVDSSGNLFIADCANNRIREVNHATGVITTVAGNTTQGFSGDGDAATAARLWLPESVAVDSSGDLFIADTFNNRIREVDHATGAITTVAGNGNTGDSGDGGPATAATLADPWSVAVDSSGDLFIADRFSDRIRKVDHATGVITTVAGGGTGGFGDGGLAIAGEVYEPEGVAVDSLGNLFIADTGSNRIRELTVGAVVTVTPAPLTITADDQSMVYGGAPPALTVTYAGLVGGDTPATFGASPNTAPAVAAPTANHVGSYAGAIVPSGAVDPNYTITYVPGKLTVTPAALKITANDQTMVYGGALPTLTVAYSGLANGDTPATFGVSPNAAPTVAAPATNHVGGYAGAIVASGAVDADYAITYVAGKLTVTPAALTITANDQTMVYGGALPTLTVSYAGVVNGDTAATFSTSPNTVPTATAPATDHVGAHAGAIVASGAVDADYTITYVAGKLTVTPAALTITANDQTMVYGGTLPTLTVSYAGLVNGDTVAAFSTSANTAPTVTAPATDHVGAHAGAIVASGAVDADYTITYLPGKLTVTPATLTITPDNKSMVYGGPLPTLTAGYSGFVNGDSAASLTTQPTLATTATAGSHVSGSPYAISAHGAVDADYAISYVAATLTVTPATLTVTAENKIKVYGADNPPLTDTIAGFVNGDAPSVVSGAASLSTTAAAASGVGIYPITVAAGTLSAADYTFAFQNGTLTVAANLQGAFGLVEDIYVIGSGTINTSTGNGVLANDSGPGQVTVTSTTVTGAEGGTFTFHPDGSFTYAPPANFPGFDYTQYAAQDALGNRGTATVNVLSQSGGVVWKFYEQVLHRDPDYAGLQGWIQDFGNGGNPGDIAAGFFESTELLNQIISGYYQQYLGRAPQGNDLPGWESVWRQTGGPEGIKAGFASSPEFNALAGNKTGANPAGWITALYQRILNRTPETGAIPFWEQQLASGVSQYQVALDFFTSVEAFDDDVTGWFYEYLDRAPTLAEQGHYANLMTGGLADRDIEEAITNLAEYLASPPASPPGAGVRLPDYM